MTTSTPELSQDQTDLIRSICLYLQQIGTIKSVDADAIEVAVQCISDSTGVDINQPSSRYIPPLDEVFRMGMTVINSQNGHPDGFEKFLKALKEKGFFEGHAEGSPEYQVRLQRAREKFFDRFGQSATHVTAEQVQHSERLKVEGNRLLSDGDNLGAIEAYTEAITLNPTNAILFANRAAAYQKLGNNEQTIADCHRAIELDFSYTKAHYRCGVAYANLKQKSKARDCFNQSLATCSDSSSALAVEIRSALAALDAPTPRPSPSSGGAPFDMNALFNNPMVQQMMQNPELMNGVLNNMMGGAATAPASSTPSTSSSSFGDSPNPMQLLTDPAAFRNFLSSPAVQAYEQDPQMGPIISDLRENGISAIMKHLSNPMLMAKLSALMKASDETAQ